MKDIPEIGPNSPVRHDRMLSRGSLVGAWLTGASVDELAHAPDDERKTVRLDDQAEAIIIKVQRIDAVAQTAAAAQVEALITERTGLQERVTELTRDLARQTQNQAAEETGQARCDGVEAVAGTGPRYDFAVEMANLPVQSVPLLKHVFAKLTSPWHACRSAGLRPGSRRRHVTS